MKISAVLIVKNEKVMLPQCLESVKDLDEIIVADTGSTDSTIEVAKQYTDKVFTEYIWDDNYAEARNYAKSKATGDWILSIDADESLYDVATVKEAVAIAESMGALAVEVFCISEDKKQKFYYPRLFKNVPEVFWENAIHNTLSVIGVRVGDVRLKIGYSPAHNDDPERSYRILKKESTKLPVSPRILYYLGREHFYRGENEDCVKVLGRYIQVSNHMAEKADAFLIMARAYWLMSMAEDARTACAHALIINANFKEALHFMSQMAGLGSANEKWNKNGEQWKKMAETADNHDVLFIRET